MTLFALMLPHPVRESLLVFILAIFWLYVPVSFMGVALYVSKQARLGRLINTERAPLSFAMVPMQGWFFITGVLVLLLLQSPLYMVLVVVCTMTLLVENGRSAKMQFGLGRMRPFSLFKASLYICGAVILVELPLTRMVEVAMDTLQLPHPVQESVSDFRRMDKPSEVASFMLQAVLLAPLMEELFFRGFLLTFLKKYTSTWLALVLSAGVFAFAHLNLDSVVQLWVLGLVLGVAYEHTGSILLPMGIHACFNLMTALSLLLERAN